MLITIKYFGMLTEVANCNEETIDFSGSDISDLLDTLYAKHSKLRDINFQVAQNKELVPFEARLTSNELVLLPPFAGG